MCCEHACQNRVSGHTVGTCYVESELDTNSTMYINISVEDEARRYSQSCRRESKFKLSRGYSGVSVVSVVTSLSRIMGTLSCPGMERREVA
jgi:hypothetical protein